ncbi:hypothetical protein ABIC28_000990 [Rhodococcus sp. PvR044]
MNERSRRLAGHHTGRGSAITHSPAPPHYRYDRTVLGLPIAMARFNYRLARLPLQLIEDVAVVRLPEESALRLGYEKALIDCDRAAADLLNDESAATRACRLHEQTAPARVTRALELRRVEQHEEAVYAAEAELLHGHRERFLRRLREHISQSPAGR